MIKQMLRISNKRLAPCARIESQDELGDVLQALGFVDYRPVLVLVGGAGGVEPELVKLINNAAGQIARAVESSGAILLDGGTHFGVMTAIGLVRKERQYQFPLLGVVLASMVNFPSRPEFIDLQQWVSSPIDRNHTHFLLVPGADWGDESIWIARSASLLAGAKPSLTVLVNGGDISRKDVENSLEANRPVLAIRGTGRLADELALQDQSSGIWATKTDEPDEIYRTISDTLSRR